MNDFEKDILKAQLDRVNAIVDNFEKANKGEGSRGGKVIGHTKSGKPIYEANKQTPSNKSLHTIAAENPTYENILRYFSERFGLGDKKNNYMPNKQIKDKIGGENVIFNIFSKTDSHDGAIALTTPKGAILEWFQDKNPERYIDKYFKYDNKSIKNWEDKVKENNKNWHIGLTW